MAPVIHPKSIQVRGAQPGARICASLTHSQLQAWCHCAKKFIRILDGKREFGLVEGRNGPGHAAIRGWDVNLRGWYCSSGTAGQEGWPVSETLRCRTHLQTGLSFRPVWPWEGLWGLLTMEGQTGVGPSVLAFGGRVACFVTLPGTLLSAPPPRPTPTSCKLILEPQQTKPGERAGPATGCTPPWAQGRC